MYKQFIKEALDKLELESKEKPKDSKAKAIYDSVISALKEFAGQDGEFAQAIVQSDKTVVECCETIAKGVGSAISDLEVYKKAVAFYFPGADISFEMHIDLCGSQNPTRHENPVIIDITAFL